MNDAFIAWVQKSRRAAGIAAAVGILVCLVALLGSTTRVCQAYWMAWIFWSGLGFGSLVIVMLHNVSGGAWGNAVRAPAEAGAMTLPLNALLLVPALFGLGHVFVWCQPTLWAAHDWPHKQAYLTPLWFSARAVLVFLILGGLLFLLGLWPGKANERAVRNLGGISGGGLVAYFALMLFASTDWVMSLEPQWYSTMFVVIFAANHFLGALALMVGLTALWRRDEANFVTKQWHDLGNLLLAFVIFWAYITFSQYLITWSGNLPREISWYLHRSAGGWPSVTVVLVFIQFAVPFVLLLSRAAKRHRQILGPIAIVIWFASVVHTWWLIAPSFQQGGVRWPWLELAAFVGIGGVWFWVFLGFLQKRIAAVPPAQEEVAHV